MLRAGKESNRRSEIVRLVRDIYIVWWVFKYRMHMMNSHIVSDIRSNIFLPILMKGLLLRIIEY